MPVASRRERIARLRRALLSPERFVDALLVVESHAGEELIRVGGCWDTQLRRYVEPPDGHQVRAHRVRLEESQLGMGLELKHWLELESARRHRRRVIIGGGNRGSGKTWFLGGLAFVIFALAFPGDWQFGVNLTKAQRRECQEAIAAAAPPDWYQDIDSSRDPRTVFLTGSTLLWLSGKRPSSIRQAGLKIRYVFINEGQDQSEAVGNNAIAAIRNTGGLLGIASNGPQNHRGDWIAAWWLGIEADELNGTNCVVDNRLNRSIDQAAAEDIRAFLYASSQAAGDADAAGIFQFAGRIAYPAFSARAVDKGGHIGVPPTRDLGVWKDETLALSAAALGGEDGCDYVCGVDFQREPGVAGVIAKLYRTETGLLVLHAVRTIAVRGVEGDFSQALHAAGFRPVRGLDGPTLLLIGDATGARQNAEHRWGQPPSFHAMRGDGWKILPPMRHWKRGTPWNPLVKDSRAQMHGLFEAHQILIAPACREADEGFPSLVESLRRAEVGPRGGLIEAGNFQHKPDGLRYLAWKFLPRPTPQKPTPTLDVDKFNQLKGGTLGFGR